jgi:hypothetical protein
MGAVDRKFRLGAGVSAGLKPGDFYTGDLMNTCSDPCIRDFSIKTTFKKKGDLHTG